MLPNMRRPRVTQRPRAWGGQGRCRPQELRAPRPRPRPPAPGTTWAVSPPGPAPLWRRANRREPRPPGRPLAEAAPEPQGCGATRRLSARSPPVLRPRRPCPAACRPHGRRGGASARLCPRAQPPASAKDAGERGWRPGPACPAPPPPGRPPPATRAEPRSRLPESALRGPRSGGAPGRVWAPRVSCGVAGIADGCVERAAQCGRQGRLGLTLAFPERVEGRSGKLFPSCSVSVS